MSAISEWKQSTTGPDETRRIGRLLGEHVRGGDVLLLEGDLGAGKTTFVQGLAQGLGVRTSVHSPTFVLANEHRGTRTRLYHLDVYRVRGPAEAVGFGLEDYMDGSGVVVIEWAEKIRQALPDDYLWLTFREIGENRREISVVARGEHYRDLLGEWIQSVEVEHVARD